MSTQTGKTIAYIRVSTADQKLDRQEDIAASADRVFREKASAKSKDRPQLVEMLNYVREGDTLHVHSVDRLARSLKDLESLVDDLVGRGVTVKFAKEGMTFTPDSENDPFATLTLQMLGAFAQFERAINLERQREGIQKARAKGRYKGRSEALTEEQVQLVRERCALGVPKATLARELGVARNTIYKAIQSTQETTYE